MAASAFARRRVWLLVLTLAVPSALMLAGITAAWPLFALPVVIGFPLAGMSGLVAATAVSGCVLALSSGRPGVDAEVMVLGLGVFLITGVVVALGHAAQSIAAARAAEVPFTDRLTSLGSEEFFLDALERESARALRHSTPLSVVVLDMDRFTEFNRRYGAEVGDRLLASVGEVVRALVRTSDVAVRIEGGQFALLVPGPADEAARVAERILRAVASLSVAASRGRQAGATMSAGVAAIEDGDDAAGTALLDRAERALDDAKAGGRDRVTLFSPESYRWGSAA